MKNKTSLYDDFLMPPFSVHDAQQGPWQRRKDFWLGQGIKSEVGRELVKGGLAEAEYMPDLDIKSIFDPVLTECYYLWHTKPDQVILDPFAGGSVRGIVASGMGRKYYGVDLSHDQIDANYEQGDLICEKNPYLPIWIQGDSEVAIPDIDSDYIFTCPPYGDLEVYSDHKHDLSNMKYYRFIDKFKNIIETAVSTLKDNRFATIVVGEFRQKNGIYCNFVADTIHAFQRAGMRYYNEAILVTNAGTLPWRARRPFTNSRKIGKTHQNVLTFVKGDPLKAVKATEDTTKKMQTTL
jgi:DNA modification methylase